MRTLNSTEVSSISGGAFWDAPLAALTTIATNAANSNPTQLFLLSAAAVAGPLAAWHAVPRLVNGTFSALSASVNGVCSATSWGYDQLCSGYHKVVG